MDDVTDGTSDDARAAALATPLGKFIDDNKYTGPVPLDGTPAPMQNAVFSYSEAVGQAAAVTESELAGDLSAIGGLDPSEAIDQAKTPEQLLVEMKSKGFSTPLDWVTRATPEALRKVLNPFIHFKTIRLAGGPADGYECDCSHMPSDGLICFFAGNGSGGVEQAVYRIILKEIERTEEEKKAGKAVAYEWIGDYMGKRRYIAPLMVNGIRKGG